METKQNNVRFRSATNADSDEIKKLIFTILAEYNLTPDENETDNDLSNIEKYYFQSGGIFDLLINEENKIIATVGLFFVDKATVELRKMYLLKSERGKGYGKLLLNHAIKNSEKLGFIKIILETASVLEEAIELYTSYGFRPFVYEHQSKRCNQSYYLNIGE